MNKKENIKQTRTSPDIGILHEDDQILVINKPAGLLSQEDHTGDPDLLTLCKEYLQRESGNSSEPFLGLVQRIDRPVSGLMVLAKTRGAAAELSRLMRNGAIQKFYLAVVEGTPPPNGVLVHHLLKSAELPIVTVVPEGNRDAKRAELHFVRLGVDPASGHSLVRIRLVTGRKHQIRAQFSEAGYPLAGDTRYGGLALTENRIALHAAELRFPHPAGGEQVRYRSEPEPIYPWSCF
ncbi:MAG: RluA family pseudouridine synthase [Balneolaceae bacterium]